MTVKLILVCATLRRPLTVVPVQSSAQESCCSGACICLWYHTPVTCYVLVVRAVTVPACSRQSVSNTHAGGQRSRGRSGKRHRSMAREVQRLLYCHHHQLLQVRKHAVTVHGMWGARRCLHHTICCLGKAKVDGIELSRIIDTTSKAHVFSLDVTVDPSACMNGGKSLSHGRQGQGRDPKAAMMGSAAWE
jgi:hypothetical protein